MFRKILTLLLIPTFLIFLSSPSFAGSPSLGQMAPEFSGKALTGEDVSLSKLNSEGKFVLVDFWASWCGPCMMELPGVVEFYKNNKSDKFEIVSVSLDTEETLDKLKEVIASYGVEYAVLYEGKGWESELALNWGINAIPAAFLVAPSGRVVLRDVYGDYGRELVKKIVELGEGFRVPEFEATVAASEDFSSLNAAMTLPPTSIDHSLFYDLSYLRSKDEENVEEMFVRLEVALKREADGSVGVEIKPVKEESSEQIMWTPEIAAACQVQDNGKLLLSLQTKIPEEALAIFPALLYFSPELNSLLSVSQDGFFRPPKEGEAQ